MIVKDIYNNNKIKTFAIAFGTGIRASGYKKFEDVAKAHYHIHNRKNKGKVLLDFTN